MEEKEIRALFESAYAQTPTLPGFFVKYDDLRTRFNRLVAERSEQPLDVEQILEEFYPNTKIEPCYQPQGTDEVFKAIKLAPNRLKYIMELKKEELKRKFEVAINATPKNNDGWFDFAQIGSKIAKEDYLFTGLKKMKQAAECILGDRIEFISGDLSKHEIPCQARYLGDVTKNLSDNEKIETTLQSNSLSTPEDSGARSQIPSAPPKKEPSAREKLFGFAYFPKGKSGDENGFDYAIRQLAEEKVLRENWYYGGKSNDGTYPILKRYFWYTFERLLIEDETHKDDPTWRKKILTNEKNAVFNTGLVDKLYEPIYAVFNRNLNEANPVKWVFWTFVKSDDKEHQILTRLFGTDLPLPAHYYNNTSELVYDIKKKIGTCNWKHFIEKCDRLPIDFLRDNFSDFDYTQPRDKEFYEKLAKAIFADKKSMNRIKNRITDAINYAIKRVRWNFKTAIPIYYPGQKQISLLLPLALVDEDNVDVALVLEATDSDAYIAHTILTLEMAYNDARLITRPDSDWLTADKIKPSTKTNDDFGDLLFDILINSK